MSFSKLQSSKIFTILIFDVCNKKKKQNLKENKNGSLSKKNSDEKEKKIKSSISTINDNPIQNFQ
jgi:hypothetical protein